MPTESFNRNLLIALLMVLAALITNAALTFRNLQTLNQNAQKAEHHHQVLAEVRHLLTILVDAETGQRGYLITGDPKFLSPYQSASLALEDKLRAVEKLMSTDPDKQAQFQELNSRVQIRMQLIRESIKTFEDEGREAVREVIRQGKGKEAMDNVRQQVEKVETAERKLLQDRLKESNVSYWTAVVTSAISAVFGLTLAIGGYALVARDLDQRQQLSAALQKSKERLEERVHARTMEIQASNQALREEISVRTKAEQAAMVAAQELQRSNRELEQFASVASHDLQEPLRKIQAFGDRLESHCKDQIGERGVDYLKRILDSAARMRKLIDDLLTYSRVSTKAQPFSAVDLNEVVQEVSGDLENRLQEAGGELQVAKLPHIQADPVQMRQLFLNLIGNALKFHRPGVAPIVQISVQNVPAPQRAGASPGLMAAGSGGNGDPHAKPPQHCEITVQDNGVGFEQIYADRIFELFQRLHGRDEYQGTGMGLAICRKIVERHSGTITAYGTPGAGSRFVFTLPIQQNQEQPA